MKKQKAAAGKKTKAATSPKAPAPKKKTSGKKPVMKSAPVKSIGKKEITPVKGGMAEKDLKYFEKLIDAKRSKLMEELGYMRESSLGKNAKEAAGDLSNYAFHMADQASDTLEKEQNFQLAQREGEFLHHLEEALHRIRVGTYGICRSCQKLINKERLEAVPHTTMCIKCKEEDQAKRRRGQE